MSAAVPRVVLDTNVLVSALVFGGGVAAFLRRAWQQGRCTPLVSTATAQELLRVLAYPKLRLNEAERESLLAEYLPYSEVVRVPEVPPSVPDCRDPADLPFLQLAVAGRAHWLVTGDRDLLVLADAMAQGRPPCRIAPMDVLALALGLTPRA